MRLVSCPHAYHAAPLGSGTHIMISGLKALVADAIIPNERYAAGEVLDFHRIFHPYPPPAVRHSNPELRTPKNGFPMGI